MCYYWQLSTAPFCFIVKEKYFCNVGHGLWNVDIQHTSFTYIFIWVRKLDSNSLTKTKNLSGRNEVTETSGRLHPLWSQNKLLHMPRTKDYRHTRQDSWIQTELAFTLAKNATKPNPFEIIPLQTARKENNWKTEEALERAAVTVETERIKGSSAWCLWWWWMAKYQKNVWWYGKVYLLLLAVSNRKMTNYVSNVTKALLKWQCMLWGILSVCWRWKISYVSGNVSNGSGLLLCFSI